MSGVHLKTWHAVLHQKTIGGGFYFDTWVVAPSEYWARVKIHKLYPHVRIVSVNLETE